MHSLAHMNQKNWKNAMLSSLYAKYVMADWVAL